MEEFKSKLPQQDGLLLRPQVRKRLKLSLQKKASKGTKPLPPQSKRGRKKQSSDYRNCVGRKAQSLRKVILFYDVLSYNVYLTNHVLRWSDESAHNSSFMCALQAAQQTVKKYRNLSIRKQSSSASGSLETKLGRPHVGPTLYMYT